MSFFSHTSGSNSLGKHPMSRNVSASLALNAAHELFSPYKALAMILTLHLSLSNCTPARVHNFSLRVAFKYIFPMSQENISSPFNDAIVRLILTLSLETNLEYVIEAGASVL
mmetsp:Transcript_9592/g.9232  ORF Transcript_9592/g.9232 Transcript_9592/m.9232 type:complete len:112 (-) Transcript_9592:96-431(-)